jgi:hypothetical protein
MHFANSNPTDGKYHAQVRDYDDHRGAGERNYGQFGFLCTTAVPTWMVG